MNLIEQLGGYGKAKKALIDAQNSNDIDPIIYINDQEVLTDCVCDALIQYRRENNIFEVGDKVVSTLKGDDFWMNLVCVIDGFHKKMIITKSADHVIHHYDFRHATDKEIAQGYRDE